MLVSYESIKELDWRTIKALVTLCSVLKAITDRFQQIGSQNARKSRK